VELRGRSPAGWAETARCAARQWTYSGWRSFIDSPHSKIVAYVKAGIKLDPPGAPIRAQLRFLSFAEDCTELCPSLYFRLKG